MKIYFDNVNFSSSSGPNTFGTRLAHELEKSGKVKIVSSKDNYDIFLCFIEPTHAPKNGTKLIQRLDGIWFKPDQFETHNELIKWAYYNSNAVVWQCNFDRNMTTKWWGDRPGEIIANGIKLAEVSLSEDIKQIREKFDRVFVSSASWHRQKRLKENTEFFVKNSGPNDCLIVMGNNPDYKISDPRIIYAGHLSHEKCLEIYRAADWMIHLAWLDHCPNVVVEAISQDCPVICTDSGGTKEIVKSNGIVIPETIKYQYQLCDYDSPPSIDIPSLSLKKVEIEKDYLNIESVSDRYFSLFQKLLPNFNTT